MELDGALTIRTRPEQGNGDINCTDAPTSKEEADRVIARLVEKISALEERIYVTELERTGMLLQICCWCPTLASEKFVWPAGELSSPIKSADLLAQVSEFFHRSSSDIAKRLQLRSSL